MIGMGDIAAGLVLAGFCVLAWRPRMNVGGRTWAFTQTHFIKSDKGGEGESEILP